MMFAVIVVPAQMIYIQDVLGDRSGEAERKDLGGETETETV